MNVSQQVIKKNITFPVELVEILDNKAKVVGFSFPEYIRHILLKFVEAETEKIPLVDSDTEASIEKSLREYVDNKFFTLRDKSDIDNYFAKVRREVK